MFRTLQITLFVAILSLGLSACGDSTPAKAEAKAEQATEKTENEAKAAEKVPEKKAEEPKKEDMKEKLAKAYTALHCEGVLGKPGKASDSYKSLGFKSPKHFLKTWKRHASKNAEWAHEVATKAEETECKK